MGNTITIYLSFLHGLMRVAGGIKPVSVEIETGTIMNFWVPTKPKNKPVVVLLHGFGLNGILTWQFQVLSLSKNYAVYVPDFLFFGDSKTNKSDRSPEFQAHCVAKGLRKLGVKKCTLVGWSYGAPVAFKMAELYPDLVDSIVVCSSVTALTESISQDALKRIGYKSWAEYLLPETPNGLMEMLDIATYKTLWMPKFALQHYLDVMFDNRKERVELLEALVISDKECNSIPNIPQKIHLVFGENDRIFNMEVANGLKQQLKGKARLHGIEKAGHLVQVERPFAYNACLHKILASLYEDGIHKD